MTSNAFCTNIINIKTRLRNLLKRVSHSISVYHVPSKLHTRNISFILPITLLGHALDRLVSVSSIHYCTSTSDLSTSSSSRGLTTYVGISHLEGGFTLRCLQRLSRPGLATLPCTWYATDTPAASPSRSSRTKDSSSQISYAHAG